MKTLDTDQRAAAEHTARILRIDAGPGAGKTEVLAQRIVHMLTSGLYQPGQIVALTFTRSMAADLRRRITAALPPDLPCRACDGRGKFLPEHDGATGFDCGACYGTGRMSVEGVTIGTLHALAAKWVRLALKGDLAGGASVKALGLVLDHTFGLAVPEDVDDMLVMAQETIGKKKITQKALKEGLTLVGRALDNWPPHTEARRQLRARNLATYDDLLVMLRAAVTAQAAAPGEKTLRQMHPCLLVDEMQDLSALHWHIIQAWGPDAMTYVGDDAQCHPPGVQIQVAPGVSVPIESLSSEQRVRGWNRNAQRMLGGRAIKVAGRQYSGLMHHIKVADRTVPMTPNHKVLARWTDRGVDVCVTYLMWRADFGYRVGWCKLFSSSGGSTSFHLAVRARIERADRVWILKTHDSRTDASIYESVISAGYGIPTATFEPVHGAQHLTEESIARIFLDPRVVAVNERGAFRCLQDHGLDPCLPLYPFPPTETDEPASRFRKAVYFPVYAANVLPGLMSLPLPDATNAWSPVQERWAAEYTGPVYSLDVDVDHAYSANGVVVLNSIYGFLAVKAGLDEAAEAARAAFDEVAVRVQLGRNYRSRPFLVDATDLVRRQIAQRGACSALPLSPARPGAPGSVDLFDHTQGAELPHTDRVVEAVQRALCVAERPEDVVVLAPLNAELDEVASALEAAGIPAQKIERAKGAWKTAPGRALVAMARAADLGFWTRFDATLVLRACARETEALDAAELAAMEAGRPLALALDDTQGARILRMNGTSAGWWQAVANAQGLEDLVSLATDLRNLAGLGALTAADALAAWIADFRGAGAPAARDFLVWLASSETATATVLREGCVCLSTLHGAKGLEWPEVVLAGTSQGSLPPVMVRPGDVAGENEWHRALYVGMTRASEGLALVCPQMLRGKFRHPTRVLIDAGIAQPNPNAE